MASYLLGLKNPLSEKDDGPNSSPKKKKEVPKVALYVMGAAFTLSTGLTLLILPYVRQASKMARPPVDFISHRNQSRLRLPPTTSTSQTTPLPNPKYPNDSLPSLQASKSSSTSSSSSSRPLESESIDPLLRRSKAFNSREERSLHGFTMEETLQQESGGGTPIGGLMGLQALVIATAMVGGFAGVGAYITGKLMGVSSMEDFAAKMRETLQINMPVLAERVRDPDDPHALRDSRGHDEVEVDYDDPEVGELTIKQWFDGLETIDSTGKPRSNARVE